MRTAKRSIKFFLAVVIWYDNSMSKTISIALAVVIVALITTAASIYIVNHRLPVQSAQNTPIGVLTSATVKASFSYDPLWHLLRSDPVTSGNVTAVSLFGFAPATYQGKAKDDLIAAGQNGQADFLLRTLQYPTTATQADLSAAIEQAVVTGSGQDATPKVIAFAGLPAFQLSSNDSVFIGLIANNRTYYLVFKGATTLDKLPVSLQIIRQSFKTIN